MKRIGIIGGGHLGIAFAKLLLLKGYDPSSVKISFRETLVEAPAGFPQELVPCIAPKSEVIANSDLVVVAVRPSDIAALGEQIRSQKLEFGALTKILSPVAGWERQPLSELFGHPVHRVMMSGAPGIEKGEGVCAVYPEDGEIYDFLNGLGLRVFGMSNESLLHIFTAGVCLTAAFLQTQVDAISFDDQEVVEHFGDLLPGFAELYAWAKSTVPQGLSKEQAAAYIGRLATKGGVTEPIVAALHEGAGMIAALERGVARSQEIADQAADLDRPFRIVEVEEEEREVDPEEPDVLGGAGNEDGVSR